MIKRTVEISDGPTFLSIELDQLVLRRQREEIGRIPCEDVGLLIVDNNATTYTHSVFTRLLDAGAAIVLCGDNHSPAGMLLSFEGHSTLTQRIAAQAAAPLPLRKRLWQQVVRAKILAQVRNLPIDDPAEGQMLAIAASVRSGDTTNCEGQAARAYWPALFGPEFRRDRDGLPPNNLLNYGYMVLRAAVARAVVSAGLHPAMGLHHHNRANPFCLADDLMEPLRPLVDKVVVELFYLKRLATLERPAKEALLSILTRQITVADQSGPLMVGLHRMAASLVRCYEGASRSLDLPAILPAQIAELDAATPTDPAHSPD